MNMFKVVFFTMFSLVFLTGCTSMRANRSEEPNVSNFNFQNKDTTEFLTVDISQHPWMEYKVGLVIIESLGMAETPEINLDWRIGSKGQYGISRLSKIDYTATVKSGELLIDVGIFRFNLGNIRVIGREEEVERYISVLEQNLKDCIVEMLQGEPTMEIP